MEGEGIARRFSLKDGGAGPQTPVANGCSRTIGDGPRLAHVAFVRRGVERIADGAVEARGAVEVTELASWALDADGSVAVRSVVVASAT